MNKKFGIAIHGGAGTIARNEMTAEKEAAYRLALDAALRVGHAILEKGGSSLDAVEIQCAYPRKRIAGDWRRGVI